MPRPTDTHEALRTGGGAAAGSRRWVGGSWDRNCVPAKGQHAHGPGRPEPVRGAAFGAHSWGPHVRESQREAQGLTLGALHPMAPCSCKCVSFHGVCGRTGRLRIIFPGTIHVPHEDVSTWPHPGGSAPWLKTILLSLASGQHELDHTGF